MVNQGLQFLKHMTTVEVQEALKDKRPLFIPIGTLEAHGRHLPVSTDTLCAEKIAEQLSGAFGGVIAPSIEYGLTNVFQQTSPASFFPIEVFKAYLEQVIRCFRKHGFETIVLVNGHGGNRDPLKDILRSITREEPLALAIINWWPVATKHVKGIYGCEPAYHAAVEETAAILTYYPELVKPELYCPEHDDYVVDDNIWLYPPPGEVLLEKEGEGRPNFDEQKAEQLMNAVVSELVAKLDKWLTSLDRFKGGLRAHG